MCSARQGGIVGLCDRIVQSTKLARAQRVCRAGTRRSARIRTASAFGYPCLMQGECKAYKGAATSWPFLLSLILLLLNDLYLKWHHPGVISGKLSDFAGLFMVSLSLFTVFPGFRTACSSAGMGKARWTR